MNEFMDSFWGGVVTTLSGIALLVIALVVIMGFIGCEMPAIDVACEDPNVTLELNIEEIVIKDGE